MDIITKNDLSYHYFWTAYGNDDPRKTGSLDSTKLNRDEGYEMLYFINKYCKINNINNIESARKLETFIKTTVPSYIQSQEEIKNYIKNYWRG